MTGWCIFLCGALISWKSKSQKSVTLSSTESEYVAISEVCQEIIFIKNILEFMGINIQFPMTVNVDNVGAIYLAHKSTGSQRTRHIDSRFHYVREYIEDGIVKVIFVKSEENKSDPFIKNVSNEVLQKHTESHMKY